MLTFQRFNAVSWTTGRSFAYNVLLEHFSKVHFYGTGITWKVWLVKQKLKIV